MAMLSILHEDDASSSSTPLWREVLRYGGIGSLIGLLGFLFLARVVYAQQEKTLEIVVQHQIDSQRAMDRLIRLTEIVCAFEAPSDAQRALCFEGTR
jgi:hypothetical protein